MKKILVNIYPWQKRVAVIQNNRLQNIYFESTSSDRLEGAFFKGRIASILPGIQTAFVDIKQERAGFLHISEVDHELAFARMGTEIEEEKTEEAPKRPPMDMGKIFKEGEQILVQVSREPIHEKGAKLTTCFTLPGRFIVLMPNVPRIGISKKIESREERLRLKELLTKLLPKGMGAIIRTSCQDKNERVIERDLAFLVHTWRSILKKYAKAKPGEKIHDDLDLVLQVVRDHLDDDVEEVIIDDKTTQSRIYRFVKSIAPEFANKILLYNQDAALFDYYDVEHQINTALEKKVQLKSGGTLIIESTEAMTVVDVNTGRFIGKKNLEDTLLKTNLEAAEEIARQLRLRNIGGLIVIDFIDLSEPQNRQTLFKAFEKNLKELDKHQSVVLRISEFGLVQMTRKRTGKTLLQQLTTACPNCHGTGFVKSLRSECNTLLRTLHEALRNKTLQAKVQVSLNPILFDYLTTVEYNALLELEKMYHCTITAEQDENLQVHEYRIKQIK